MGELSSQASVTPAERLVIDVIRTWAVQDHPSPQQVVAAANRALRALDEVDAAEIPDILGLTSSDAIRRGCLLNRGTAEAYEGWTREARTSIRRVGCGLLLRPRYRGAGTGARPRCLGRVASLGGAAGDSGRGHRRRSSLLTHPSVAVALVALAHVARERDTSSRRHDLLDAAAPGTQRTYPSVLTAMCAAEVALIALAQGEPERGIGVLAAHRSARRPAAPKRVASQLRTAEAQLLLALGDLDRAEQALDQAPYRGGEVAGIAVRVAVASGLRPGPTASRRLARGR